MRTALAALLLLCCSLVAACFPVDCGGPSGEGETTPSIQSELPPPRAVPSARSDSGTTWAEELAGIDSEIVRFEALAAGRPGDWVSLQRTAGLLLKRARLTGSYDDYARAEASLLEAFKRAPPTSGPVATRASLNFSLHRLDRVGPDLDRLEALPALLRPKPQALSLRRGTLAFQLGQYSEARRHIQESVDSSASHPALSSLALYFWKTGDFEAAEDLYRQALAAYHGRAAEPVAWTHLQLGIMDLERGRWSAAQQHYEEAGRALAGWYLVDEHLAEVLLLQGNRDEAVAIYERVIDATGSPEFMAALAGIEEERGRSAAARSWIERADAAYAEQLTRFPEAAYGHALDHFAEFGRPERALDLAEKNHAIRPNGEAKTSLAAAYLAAGRIGDATRLVEEALASPYRTAELHAVASEVLDAGKLRERAAEQRRKALAIHPLIFD
ncbi:MAG: tetratricopeptide repeat protein [Myxococcota bacterium]|nr:tetratricopeptide repeat protein [Myxococcota bacterium]